MIENFEEQTEPLPPKLMPVVQWLDDYFAGRTTHPVPTLNKKIKAFVLQKMIAGLFSMKFGGTNLRKCINHLRQKGTVPIGSSNRGYYTCQNDDEVQSNIRSLNQRANGVLAAARGLERFTPIQNQME